MLIYQSVDIFNTLCYNIDMRVLVTGDRNWADREAIRSWLPRLQGWGFTEVIEGGARGADTIAQEEAVKLRMSYQRFPAQWDKYGRAAGPIRNQTMLDATSPSLVIYFHHDLANSKGTRDMVNRAIKAGIPVINGSGIDNTESDRRLAELTTKHQAIDKFNTM